MAPSVLLLAVLGLVTYANCLDNPLIIDDRILILDDPRVQEGRYTELATGEYWPGAHGNRLYRPLTSLSIAANWACCPTPGGLRLPNLILHIGCGVLVWLLAARLTGSRAAGLVAAAVFVVHPIHATPLNSVVDRAEIGAAFFAMLTLILLWPAPRTPEKGPVQETRAPTRLHRSLAASASFAVALLFKESAVTIIGVVLLVDLCLFGGIGGSARSAEGAGKAALSSMRRWISRRFLPCVLPLLVVAGGYIVLRAAVLESVARPAENIAVIDNIIAHPSHGLAEGESVFLARWGTPAAVFGKASRLLLVPDPLSWDYSYAAIDSVKSPTDPRFITGMLCLAAVVAGMIVSFRRRRRVAFALGFLLITYSLTSNTVIIIGTIFAERYLYLPSVGLCLLVGVLTAQALSVVGGSGERTVRAAAGLFLLLLGTGSVVYAGLTIDRNRDFVSEANVNRVDLDTNPRSCRLLTAVAGDLYTVDDFVAAGDYATRATRICPEFPTAWQLAGLARWRRGDDRGAIPLLERAVRLGAGRSEQVAVAIADIHRSAGDFRTAMEVLDRFVRQDVERTAAAARNNLAWYLIIARPPEIRDPERALPLARQAVEIHPGQADYIDTLVSVLVALDRREEAVSTLEGLLPTVNRNDPFRRELEHMFEALAHGSGG